MDISKTEIRNTLLVRGQDNRDKKLRKACKDFEAVFTYQLLKSMRKTVQKCNLFHGGEAEEVYQSLLDMQLAKDMADLGPGSLSRLLYEQFKQVPGSGQVNASEVDPRLIKK